MLEVCYTDGLLSGRRVLLWYSGLGFPRGVEFHDCELIRVLMRNFSHVIHTGRVSLPNFDDICSRD